MPTYLYDVEIRGLVDAYDETEAHAILEHIAEGAHDIYVDEVAVTSVMVLPRQPQQEPTDA